MDPSHIEKLQTIQVQQRSGGAQSQGKHNQTFKHHSKDVNRNEFRGSNLMMNTINNERERVTPKKLIDKKELNMQKYKTRNEMNKT